MRSRRDIGLALLSILAAVVLANVLADVLGVGRFDGLRGGVVALVASAALGAASGAILARLRSATAGKTAAIAAICAATVTFLLLRVPSPWIDLGPFGAGPLTAVALVVLPIAQIGALLGLRRWAER